MWGAVCFPCIAKLDELVKIIKMVFTPGQSLGVSQKQSNHAREDKKQIYHEVHSAAKPQSHVFNHPFATFTEGHEEIASGGQLLKSWTNG